MGYWREVAKQAWASTRKTLRIETLGAVVILVVGQSIMAYALWYWAGDANLPTRIATIALPFLLLLPTYAAHFLAIPGRMHSDMLGRLEATESKLSDAPKPLIPDWTIGALFHHLDPRIGDRQIDKPIWENVGCEVLDKLATGQVMAWGRLDNDGDIRPMRPIRREYWEDAEWTYFFVDNQPREAELVHCKWPWFKKQVEEYRDVRFNKQQAMAIWPTGAS